MENLISVIVPAYNVAQWISKCLESIMNQTYKKLEIIVIDDGSTDETPQILDRYANIDSRIKVVHQKNSGLVKVRNKGIELDSGEYVAFVDGDDTIIPEMYERLLKNALKYDADISHCGVCFCFSDGHEEQHYGTGYLKIQNNVEGLKDLLEGKFIEPGLWNKLYKSTIVADSCIDETVLNNEDLLRNYVLFERAKKSVFEDFCGYRYYQREGSMSKDKSKKVRIEKHIRKARKLIVDRAPKEVYPYAMQTYMGSIINSINALIYDNDSKSKEYCEDCRKILRKERKHLHYLIKRQQLAARLYLLSPVLYKLVYCIYKNARYK